MAKISVIVTVYNVEKYLDKCIDSIINQTFSDFELILVDDGSTDNCPKMCDDWAKKDKRIKVIHKPNGGQSDARNVGMQICTGEYLYFCDSDDYVESNLFEKCLNIIEEKNVDAISFLMENFYEDGRTIMDEYPKADKLYDLSIPSDKKEIIEKISLHEIICGTPLWFFKADIILKNNLKFFDAREIFGNDLHFALRLTDYVNKIYYLAQPLYHYLIRSNSEMGKTKNNILFNQMNKLCVLLYGQIKDQSVIDDFPILFHNVVYNEINKYAFPMRVFSIKPIKEAMSKVEDIEFFKKMNKDFYLKYSKEYNKKYSFIKRKYFDIIDRYMADNNGFLLKTRLFVWKILKGFSKLRSKLKGM